MCGGLLSGLWPLAQEMHKWVRTKMRSIVTLSGAKNLSVRRNRFFAALRMTENKKQRLRGEAAVA
jgi:hypothetical protein